MYLDSNFSSDSGVSRLLAFFDDLSDTSLSDLLLFIRHLTDCDSVLKAPDDFFLCLEDELSYMISYRFHVIVFSGSYPVSYKDDEKPVK